MLESIITTLRSRLDGNYLVGMNESNTERSFVIPILRALNWDCTNPNEVYSDYYIKNLDPGSPVYFALLDQNIPLLLVEVKPLYSDLSKITQTASRVINTASASQAKYLVFCNGVEWRVYNVKDIAEEAKLVLQVNIQETDAANKLSLFTKVAIKEGILDRFIAENLAGGTLVKSIDGNPFKSRGYKVSDEVHQKVNALRQSILFDRTIRDQIITNNYIVEHLLKVFFEDVNNFNTSEIANEVILEQQIRECLKKRFKNN